MPVLFKCTCGKYLSVRSKYIGKKIRCPACGDVTRVPDPTQKRSRPLKRVETRALDASKFRRLKEAAQEDRPEVLEEKEVDDLDLEEKGSESSSDEQPLPSRVGAKKGSQKQNLVELELPGSAEDSADDSSDEDLDLDEDLDPDLAQSDSSDSKPALATSKKGPPTPATRGKKSEPPPPPKQAGGSEKKAPAKGKEEKAGPSIDLTCFCGRKFSVGSEKAGQNLVCESCGRTILVPSPKRGEADLDLVPLEAGEPCPKCGALLREDEEVCHACGAKHHKKYDLAARKTSSSKSGGRGKGQTRRK